MRCARMSILGVLFLVSCIQSDVVSYTDPAQGTAAKYTSVLVLALGMSPQEMDAFESAATEAFTDHGTRALRSRDLVPPTQKMADVDIGAAISSSAVQSLLIIAPIEKGYTVARPSAQYTAMLADWETALSVWQSDTDSDVSAYDGGDFPGSMSDVAEASTVEAFHEELARAAAYDLVAKLIDDRIF